MTEEEWLASTDPSTLLNHVCPIMDDDPRMRKVRLFTAAYLRSIWDHIKGDLFRQAVELVETVADDPMQRSALSERHEHLHQISPRSRRTRAEAAVIEGTLWNSLNAASWGARRAVSCSAGALGHAARKTEKQKQSDLFRDIFGNPFRPVSFDAAWRTGTAMALARGMYESRDFGAMPILADALQDAGCDSADVLDHCRDPHATHYRGCWVVDLVLGKE
jgi:hypothetical protein